MREIRFELPGGGVMCGWTNGSPDAPDYELAEIRHPTPGGGYMVETIWRAVELAAPAPAPDTPPEAQPDGE